MRSHFFLELFDFVDEGNLNDLSHSIFIQNLETCGYLRRLDERGKPEYLLLDDRQTYRDEFGELRFTYRWSGRHLNFGIGLW